MPSLPPVITEAHSISPTRIHVEWQPVSRDHAHGIVLGYNIQFREHKARAPTSYTYVQSDKLSVELRGLQPFTEYCIKVSAYTRKGDGEPGSCHLALTDETGKFNSDV